ncbi:hypothetical protein MLD38_036302 [Melastoma candidum]|uniref:Uncharacterized protein n=1 Tax=Melastoma candidum TaxID=119954 RepID=A0ACB9LJ78_9MYRT|nr:hypothetical protein MLD38_036302 [Melastoma candidum]
MISSKKLLQLAKKWQMVAKVARKRISLGRTSSEKGLRHMEEASVARKGHFAIYTTDGGRFEIPLSCLANGVIRELFAIAEEVFGIPGKGPIVLPVDASSMEQVMSMIRQGLSPEQEITLLRSLTRCRNSYFAADEVRPCPLIVCT